MTGTRAIGLFFGAIINAIVRWLALSKIHPNVLTFLGLLINIWAAWLFAAGSFRWAGVVVTGAAIFDMVDGRVARATSQVTRFGGFFDSVLDRYSRPGAVHRPAGLLRQHQSLLLHRADRHRHDGLRDDQLHAGARGERHPQVQSGIPGASGARGADHHRRAVRSHGGGVVGDRGALERHRGPPHDLHLPAGQTAGRRATALCLRTVQED